MAIFNGSQDGLDPVAAFPLSGAASNLNFGDFGDGSNDLAFLAGGKVQILRASTMKLQSISLPITASALAVGNFVIDRVPGLQLALLTADGTIHIAAHNEFDPRAYTSDELKALHPPEILRGDPNPLLARKGFSRERMEDCRRHQCRGHVCRRPAAGAVPHAHFRSSDGRRDGAQRLYRTIDGGSAS